MCKFQQLVLVTLIVVESEVQLAIVYESKYTQLITVALYRYCDNTFIWLYFFNDIHSIIHTKSAIILPTALFTWNAAQHR